MRLPDCLHTNAFKMYATLDQAVQNDYAALKQAFSTYFRGSQGGSRQYGISRGFPSVLHGDKSIYDFGIECQKVAYDNVHNDPAQRDIMAKTLFIHGCSWDIQSFDFYRRAQDPTLQFIDFVGEIIKLHDMYSLKNKGKETSQVRFQLPEKNSAKVCVVGTGNNFSKELNVSLKNKSFMSPPKLRSPPASPSRKGSLSPNWRERDSKSSYYPDSGSLPSVLNSGGYLHRGRSPSPSWRRPRSPSPTRRRLH